MSPKERIDFLLKHAGLNAKQLADSIGVTPTQIYDIRSGKTKSITESIADKILLKYSEYSKSWLLTGEGEMLKSGSEKKPVDSDCEGLLATIRELSETVNRQSKEIERLNIELDKYKKASFARGEDAGCAAAGATG